MKQEEANKIIGLSKAVSNIQTLLGDLLMPISEMQTKYNCTPTEACNMKMHADDWLTKYGCMTLDASVKGLQQLAKKVDDEPQGQQQTVKVLQTVYHNPK